MAAKRKKQAKAGRFERRTVVECNCRQHKHLIQMTDRAFCCRCDLEVCQACREDCGNWQRVYERLLCQRCADVVRSSMSAALHSKAAWNA